MQSSLILHHVFPLRKSRAHSTSRPRLRSTALPERREPTFINCSFWARWRGKYFVVIRSWDCFHVFFILCSNYLSCAKVAGRDQRTNCGLRALLSLCVSEGSNSQNQAWQQAPTPTEPSRQPLSIMFKRSVLRLRVTDVEDEVRK